MDVDDASWPILLEAMLGPGFNGSVISPTATEEIFILRSGAKIGFQLQ